MICSSENRDRFIVRLLIDGLQPQIGGISGGKVRSGMRYSIKDAAIFSEEQWTTEVMRVTDVAEFDRAKREASYRIGEAPQVLYQRSWMRSGSGRESAIAFG